MNNRQAGRRRGRGGQQQRPQGNAGGRDTGNRIDNRARGNAAQLLEKYKSLATEAQRQGDRVNAEYYHQFADHYFRVLGESRARFDEQNKRQQSDGDDDNNDYDDDQDNAPQQQYREQRHDRDQNGNGRDQGNRDQSGRDQQGDREPRQDRQRADRESRQDREPREARPPRDDREPRQDRGLGRSNGQGNGHAAESAGHETAASDADEAPVRRRGRPRRDAQPVAAQAEDAGSGFDANILPPSLVGDTGSEEPKPKRRRRVAPEDAAAE